MSFLKIFFVNSNVNWALVAVLLQQLDLPLKKNCHEMVVNE